MNTSAKYDRNLDPIDRMIFEDGIRIQTVYFHKELDVMLILLNNRKIMERRISMSKRLAQANEDELKHYEISRTGIHWPHLDEDLSLRGFLQEEMLKAIRVSETS